MEPEEQNQVQRCLAALGDVPDVDIDLLQAILLKCTADIDLGAVVLTDQDADRVLYVNQAFTRMTGVSPEEALSSGFDSTPAVHPDDLDHYTEMMRRQVAGTRSPSDHSSWRCIHKDGSVRHALTSAVSIQHKGKNYRMSIVVDVTKRVHAFEQLRRTLDGAIKAMALTVETRDPYTAGHQKRVASLSTAIAEEMAVPSEKVEGIQMAGGIHDLGKLRVPADILSNPGRLSEPEFAIIKTHPQVACDILSAIEFPWPVSEIVYQHHERIDGSGYPEGLQKNEILIEARIIGVADVVEAMASHRPYRPALGIERALAEIREGSGTRYDPDAANACVALFENKGYSLADTTA
ncbi:HD domain-containing phosphohydrolase [Candidatus Bipolaricaulota bacterium]